jgi:hypothetical protein
MEQNEVMAAASYRATVCLCVEAREKEEARGRNGGGEGERERKREACNTRIIPLYYAYSDKSNGEKEIPVDPILCHVLLVISTLNDHQPESTNHQQW